MLGPEQSKSSSSRSLIRVSDSCHLLLPCNRQGGSAEDAPQFILVFGWIGATLQSLKRFSDEYARKYPGAAQVLIQSDLFSSLLGSREINVYRQRPIVKALSELGLFTEASPRLMVHVISNGGALQLLWLSLAIASSKIANSVDAHAQKPVVCVILDSAPGALRYADLRRILTFSRTGLTRLLGSTAASLLHSAFELGYLITGRPSMHSCLRDGLNNPRLLPWTDAATPRLYIYSDADDMCRPEDVRAHVQEAREAGLNVLETKFERSPHVMHARLHPGIYWTAVHARWTDAVRARL